MSASLATDKVDFGSTHLQSVQVIVFVFRIAQPTFGMELVRILEMLRHPVGSEVMAADLRKGQRMS